ncbi:MAG: rhodanese [Marivirga sp.]|nr:rhodanese [Marivirga sp.]
MSTSIEHFRSKLQFETDPSDLFQALESGQLVFVIDARTETAYNLEHIPGSLNLPHRKMTKETTAHLDKTVLYVTYCDGTGCNASTKGALNMARLGFRVQELIGGLEWWKQDGYATEGLRKTMGKKITCAC